MSLAEIQILLIEDNPGDARIIQEWLKEDPSIHFNLTHTPRLDIALAALAGAENGIQIVLLDLSLPDSQGIMTLYRVRDQVPDLPIVVLTGFDDEHTAIQAVQSGAQDYLIKDQLSRGLLIRSIRYALERHSQQQQLARLSMIDDLTGLYNRRGFFKLVEQQIELSRRHPKKLLFLYADVDFLKKVNDEGGHETGDQLLVETADLLRKSFRSSDILARIGGDEFAGLAIEFAEDSPDRLISRIEGMLQIANQKTSRSYTISISVGAQIWNPDQPQPIEELMAQADARMYAQKKAKHQQSLSPYQVDRSEKRADF